MTLVCGDDVALEGMLCDDVRRLHTWTSKMQWEDTVEREVEGMYV